MRSPAIRLLVLGGLIVASCEGGESTETTQSGVGTTTSSTTTTAPSTTTTVPETTMVEAAPFHAIPDDAVAVTGTATCEFFVKGGGLLTVECVLDMSDPRVSGNEIHPDMRFFAEGPDGRLWVTEEAVITNEEGTWQGSAQAAEDYSGIPSGEAHYVGEGGYEGLVFHYYFFHPDLADKAELRGWISGGG